MGKEIEIRYQLNNKVRLIEWLDVNATKIGISHQIDTYYDNAYHSFITDVNHIYEWLRIREEDNHTTFNYKHWLPEGQVKRTYCNEYELEISSAKDMQNILFNLGFEVFIVVDKVRHIWKYKECEIAIDAVTKLGDYIEIEYKGSNDDDVHNINQYLHEILQEISANVGEEDYGGYGFKLIQQKYK